jgi:hypothetical protein
MSKRICTDCGDICDIKLAKRPRNVIYTARLKVNHEPGVIHEVYIDGFDTPVIVGAHGIVKKRLHTIVHPKVPEPSEETILSFEYLITALAASLMNALNYALEARGILLEPDGLIAEVEGDFEKDIGPPRPHLPGRTPLLSRIRIRYRLKVPRGKRQIVEEVLQAHLQGTSIFQSIREGIKAYWDCQVEEAD